MVMPQLDFTTFPSQIFWLVITFSLLYFSVHFFIIPRIKKCIDDRGKLIESIESKIKEHETQMNWQKLKYENGIKDANAIAKDIIHDVEIWMKNYQEEQDDILHQKIKLMFEENEMKIVAFKENARNNFEKLVFDIAVMYNIYVLNDDFSDNSLKLKSYINDFIGGK